MRYSPKVMVIGGDVRTLFIFLMGIGSISPMPVTASPCITSFIKAARPGGVYQRPNKLIPIGMTPKNMNQLLKLFMDDPFFNSADVMVLFGSRTHFEHGIQPLPSSDLDVAISFQRPSDSFELHEQINDRLQSVAETAGFPISQQIPMMLPLKDYASKIDDPGQIQQAADLLDLLAEDGHWSRLVHKQVSNTIADDGGLLFNLDAIFVFKKFPDPELLRVLKSVGYHNFIFLTTGTGTGS